MDRVKEMLEQCNHNLLNWNVLTNVQHKEIKRRIEDLEDSNE